MDIPFELRFLGVFFTVVLLGQAAIVLAWFAMKAIMRGVASMRRQERGEASPEPRVSPTP